MQLSGINLDVYKAHSTRAASVSAAHRAQVPVQEILRKAECHLFILLPFIMTRIKTLQRVVTLSFRRLF